MLPPLILDGTAAPLVQLGVIILATFASEDLTCIGVGLLVRSGALDPLVGLVGCCLGIFAGDLGLWGIGRLVGRGLDRWFSGNQLTTLNRWFERRGWAAVLACRFLPGTRVPLYLAVGVLGRHPGRLILWTALAVLLWTPLLVLTVALFGTAIVPPVTYLVGPGWSAFLVGGAALYLVVRLALLITTASGRGKLLTGVARLWRWEFWPGWLFYLPVLPYLLWLSLRYRSLLLWTAANPGIPQGGVVGESKAAILEQLPRHAVIPSLLVPPGELAERMELVRQAFSEKGWTFPLILKPDASQRGAGVKRVNDLSEVETYLHAQPAALLVQTYHPGPYEAGIFYYRLPGEEKGHIFSITDKVFPLLLGDGQSSVEELIWHHPRYRMQARTFLARHASQRDRILAPGETLPLTLAGNHCQGTLFRDGAHLFHPELEQAVDAIARHFPGFFIGRFDIRYSDAEAFRAGRDLAIVELNGVTSESTNIYDPSWSLMRAYRTLFRQWSLLYRIGAANRQRGHAPARLFELLDLLLYYYRHRRIDPLAD